MYKVSKTVSILLFSILCVLSFQNCSFKQTPMGLESKSSSLDSSSSLPDTPTSTTPAPVNGDSIEAKAITLLQNKCYACHGTSSSGGISQINNPAHLISTGQIIPGNPSGSPIYTAVTAGRMPIGSTLLTITEQSILNDWILSGANAPSTGTTLPPMVIPLDATYTGLQANVFAPKCVYCHSTTVSKGGVKLDSYTAVRKYISGISPQKSKIYSISASGEMPPSSNSDLTAEELKALSDWIVAGSLNN